MMQVLFEHISSLEGATAVSSVFLTNCEETNLQLINNAGLFNETFN